jgi:hypothetical protein
VIFKVSVSHDHKRLAAQRGGSVLPYIAFSKHSFSSYEDKGVLQIGPPPVKGAAFCARETLDGKDRSDSFALEENGADCKTV